MLIPEYTVPLFVTKVSQYTAEKGFVFSNGLELNRDLLSSMPRNITQPTSFEVIAFQNSLNVVSYLT